LPAIHTFVSVARFASADQTSKTKGEENMSSEITPIARPKPMIEVEIRGKSHIGKTAVAAVIINALRQHFPDNKVNIVSTDGQLEEAMQAAEQEPEGFKDRLRNAGRIAVLDVDNPPVTQEAKAA
jgi:spore germination cell wall hydrolase CwlJ-like protein